MAVTIALSVILTFLLRYIYLSGAGLYRYNLKVLETVLGFVGVSFFSTLGGVWGFSTLVGVFSGGGVETLVSYFSSVLFVFESDKSSFLSSFFISVSGEEAST